MYIDQFDIFKELGAYFIPQGYTLVEDTDHKIKRLEAEAESDQLLISIYEKQLADLHLSIDNKRKQIEALKAGN